MRRSCTRTAPIALALSAALLGSVVVTAPAGAATMPTPRSTPFVRLWTEVNNAADAKAVNELTGTALTDRLNQITSWYVHAHSQGSNAWPMGDPSKGSSSTTLAEKLAGKGMMVSNYRNGSYVSQAESGQVNFGEAALIEKESPLAIATFWPGFPASGRGSTASTAARVPAAVSATQRTLTVRSASAYRPSGAPASWPFIPSRGTGAGAGQVNSKNTHDFVSWVRVDDEIMRVRAVAGGSPTVTLTVDRGYFGTTAAAHAAESRVHVPVYVGSSTASSYDTGLAGAPNVDRADKALRYGIKVWQGSTAGAKKNGIGWIVSRIKSTFAAGRAAPYLQGYNTVWLDTTSCAQYNNADPGGSAVTPWSDPHGTIADGDKWGEHQLTKIAGLRAGFGGSSGYPALRFVANNLASQGDKTTACRNKILAAVDGGVFERWMNDSKTWTAQVEQSLQVQAKDWPALYWVKTSQMPGGFTASQYKRFTYGTFLLTKRDGTTRYQFGGMNHGLGQPDELFRWDFGAAVDKPTTVAQIPRQACGSSTVYRRGYAKGFVLVNTGTTSVTCSLGTQAYDVVGKTGSQPTLRGSVTIGPRDAAFLLTS